MVIETILEKLKDNKDTLKNLAKVYEDGYLKDAFKTYEKLNDKENMERVAKDYFFETSYNPENLLNKIGLKATADLYSEKGDNFIKKAENYKEDNIYSSLKIKKFESAIENYLKGNDELKIDETISKIKQTANNYVKGE